MTQLNPISLADWRRQIFELYACIRDTPLAQRHLAWENWRAKRDDMFLNHEMTPLNADQRASFEQVAYFDYDPALCVLATVDRDVPQDELSIELAVDGTLRLTRVATLRFTIHDSPQTLSLYWINGYGGGLFIPFRDQTSGNMTYGGGRYLYDSIKGSDLGMVGDQMILDFNFSYNPSCAYNSLWVCPLAPADNHLPIEIRGGEQTF